MTQSIAVSISETYDLSTTLNKMGLIAIRTPGMQSVEKRYPGFVRNFKFLRVKSCDVVISCASSLPADPLQIGTAAGSIAPQDMFNPLLYKAVSNDSWNGLLNRIYGSTGAVNSLGGTVRFFQDAFSAASSADSINSYYALLSDPSFKKAHVQQGLEMRRLVPLVYHVLNAGGTTPNMNGATLANVDELDNVNAVGNNGVSVSASNNMLFGGTAFFKGRPVPMPPVECTTSVVHPTDGTVTQTVFNPIIGNIPSTYVAAIVTPPATLNITYFRMTVRWNLEFFGVASDIAKALMPGTSDIGRYAYFSSNVSQQTLSASKISDVSETAVNADDQEHDIQRTVEADGVTLDLIMEK
ncbi:putative capsid protein [Sheep faeces associated smacovirus 2]|uniref:Putative capsid protein n=1 Tax=Sheep faeces associated smacovirus 2 TaxID=1843757 RepID=A0A161J5M0_9VIRU|nr:putative capsid protein [Sheep faeces associated smacovirus 2]ANC51529.1 putative capsid protein [Sheep faeces associated smacovirus 2]